MFCAKIVHRRFAGGQSIIVNDNETTRQNSGIEMAQDQPGRFIKVAVQPQHRDGIHLRLRNRVPKPAFDESGSFIQQIEALEVCLHFRQAYSEIFIECPKPVGFVLRIIFHVRLGQPGKGSNNQTLRVSSLNAARIARMRIQQPPRQTPVSTKSPGIPSSNAERQQFCRFSRRFVPTIVTASSGQSLP